MRTAESAPGGSATPIYDALCSEYRRLFRTLPGDRSGEESMQFNGFETPYRPGRHRGRLPALPPGGGSHDNRLHG
jgi:hypothetical protein